MKERKGNRVGMIGLCVLVLAIVAGCAPAFRAHPQLQEKVTSIKTVAIMPSNVKVYQVAVGNELTHTKKKFAKRMSPQDVAEVELDEARSDQGMRNFDLLENVPFQVTGFPGFKLVYTFKTENGLRMKRVHHGVLVRDWVYRVQYQAAARYYFDKDLATLERVRESFKVTDKP